MVAMIIAADVGMSKRTAKACERDRNYIGKIDILVLLLEAVLHVKTIAMAKTVVGT